MANALPLIVCSAFLVIALWHFQMAARLPRGESAAVPSVDGKPVFVPSAPGTVAIGVALTLCAVLVAGTAGLISLGVPIVVLRWLCSALALGLAARAVGDFRYVGFFKRVRGSKFATFDTFVYSPLCVLLGAGVALVAYRAAG
ncbi:MAG: DUF3995 domain-containing protein [Rhodanobacteraceae bacterium]